MQKKTISTTGKLILIGGKNETCKSNSVATFIYMIFYKVSQEVYFVFLFVFKTIFVQYIINLQNALFVHNCPENTYTNCEIQIKN